MEHELKILPQYFKEVANGNKTFEIRKNDRGFRLGDTLLLKEIEEKPIRKVAIGTFYEQTYTGQEITKEISYIYEGGQHGLAEGYCILGLKTAGKEDILNELIEKYELDAKEIQKTYERYMWNINYYKDAIKLKNIDLTGISQEEQSIKDSEEIEEFKDALIDYELNKTKENKSHLIEEFWDRVQTPLGLLNMYGITAQEVMEGYSLHENKLLNRPRKKECKKCRSRSGCRLYLSDLWKGQEEAERCQTYNE